MKKSASVQCVLSLAMLVVLCAWAIYSSLDLASYAGAIDTGRDPVSEPRNPYFNVFSRRDAWQSDFAVRAVRRAEQLRDDMPRGEVGYITSATGLEADYRYHLTAFALAPTLIERGDSQRFVIADFDTQEELRAEYATGRWIGHALYPPGLALLERKDAP